MLLEICAFNIQSCFIAQRAGAGRIELCANPLQGGTTPSYGIIQYALEHIKIPVYPIIRPNGGGFVYDNDDLDIIKKDILACKELGCKGISTGVLHIDDRINASAIKQIVEWAYPMEVTFHKAFDEVPNAFEALETIIGAGCTRVLTSGLHSTAIEGAGLLAQLVEQAAGRIIVMPGGGIRAHNIIPLATGTRATEFHSAALIDKLSSEIADEQEIKMMCDNLQIL